jgi:hypothetical protein
MLPVVLETAVVQRLAISALSQVTCKAYEVWKFTDEKKLVRRIFGDKFFGSNRRIEKIV